MCGLDEIQMEMSLLEMEVKLMIIPTISFRTMNATQYWCLKSSPAVQHLVSLIRGSFSKRCPSDLGKAQGVRLRFNTWVSSCTFPQAR